MQTSQKIISTLGLIIFTIGIFLGMTLAAGTIVAALEANFYFGYNVKGQERLNMICPKIMTTQEIGFVRVTLTNPTEKKIEPLFQVDISNPGLFQSIRERASIGSGETESIEWTISSDNVVFNYFIFVKIFQFAAFKTPTRDGFCGIVVVDIPSNGTEVLVISILTSLLCVIAGILMWTASSRSLRDRSLRAMRAMIAVAVSVLVTMIFGLLGSWLMGVLFFMISLLLIGEVVRSFLPS